jgi:hypothetical protein
MIPVGGTLGSCFQEAGLVTVMLYKPGLDIFFAKGSYEGDSLSSQLANLQPPPFPAIIIMKREKDFVLHASHLWKKKKRKKRKKEKKRAGWLADCLFQPSPGPRPKQTPYIHIVS